MALCKHYCSHGGRFSKNAGHSGLHDASGYCQWPDNESVSREEAGRILAAKPGGRDYLGTMQPMEDMYDAMLGDDDDVEGW